MAHTEINELIAEASRLFKSTIDDLLRKSAADCEAQPPDNPVAFPHGLNRAIVRLHVADKSVELDFGGPAHPLDRQVVTTNLKHTMSYKILNSDGSAPASFTIVMRDKNNHEYHLIADGIDHGPIPLQL